MLLVACATDSLPTSSVPTATVAAPARCALDRILSQVDALMSGSDYEADYLTINHQLALSIWLVDPEIDLATTSQTVPANAHHAFVTGARLAYRMVSQVPCVRKLFEVFNPMIVDRDYNGWYIDIIPMRAIPNSSNPTDDELISGIEQSGMQIGYLRRTPPHPQETVVTGETCTWAQAHAEIQNVFGSKRRNVSAYLIGGYQAIRGDADGEPLYAQVQWDVSGPEEAQQESVLATLEQLTSSLTCLTPPVDRLETYIVDGQGRLMAYALIPGSVIRAGRYPLDPNQFTLIFFKGQ